MSQIHGLSDVTKRLSHIESLLANNPHCVNCELDIKTDTMTSKKDLELSNLKERMIIIEEQLSTVNSTLMKLKRDIKK